MVSDKDRAGALGQRVTPEYAQPALGSRWIARLWQDGHLYLLLPGPAQKAPAQVLRVVLGQGRGVAGGRDGRGPGSSGG